MNESKIKHELRYEYQIMQASMSTMWIYDSEDWKRFSMKRRKSESQFMFIKN